MYPELVLCAFFIGISLWLPKWLLRSPTDWVEVCKVTVSLYVCFLAPFILLIFGLFGGNDGDDSQAKDEEWFYGIK